MELFRLLGTIAIDNAKAIAGLNETSAKAKTTSEKMATAFTTIGQKSIDLGKKLAGLSAGASVAFGGMIKAAADVKAQNAQFEASFGELQDAANKSFNAIAKDTGVLATRLKVEGTKAFSQFKGAGLEASDALKQTDKFTRLAADGAAYYDMSLEETSELMRSFIRGNTEAGDRIGLFTSETQRNARALELLGKKYIDCTEAEKQMVMMDIASSIYETSGAMGQAAREADGWENVMGNFKESIRQFSASLGELVLPAVTKFVQKATKFIIKLQDMGDGAKTVIVAFVGLTAVASPVLIVFGSMMKTMGKMIGTYTKTVKAINAARVAVKNYQLATEGASIAAGVANGQLTKQQAVYGKLSAGASKLFGVLRAHPFVLVGAAAVGFAATIWKVYNNTHQATIAANEFSDANNKNIASIKSNSKEAEFYAQKLDELSQKENKSSQDKQLMQAYVDKLNESVDGLNLSYDAENDKLNQTTDSIYKKIDAMKQEALQSAYIKQSKKALDEYAESQIKLTQAQDDLKASQKEWNSLSDSEKQTRGDLAKKIQEQKSAVNDLKTATASYWQEYVRQSNQAAIASGQWEQVVNDAKAAGIKIPQSLTKGIKEGQYVIPQNVEELNALIKFDKAVQNATGDGKKLADNLATQIANGEISVTEATKKLTDANKKQLEKGATEAGKSGQNTGKKYAEGTESKKTAANNAGKALGESAKAGAGSVSLYQTGKNIGDGLASGLRASLKAVESAANAVASAADAAIKKKQQIASPSKLQEWNASMMGKGIVNGLMKSIPYVQAASEKLADAATVVMPAVTQSYDIGSSAVYTQAIPTAANITENSQQAANNETATVLKAILAAIKQMDAGMYQKIEDALDNRKIQWNDRELGRFVRTYA